MRVSQIILARVSTIRQKGLFFYHVISHLLPIMQFVY